MSWALFFYSGLKLIYWESGYFRACVSTVDEIGSRLWEIGKKIIYTKD